MFYAFMILKVDTSTKSSDFKFYARKFHKNIPLASMSIVWVIIESNKLLTSSNL